MAAKRERTKTPGVFKRGSRYDVAYRDPDGRLRWKAARTYDEARRLKARLIADVSSGEWREPSTMQLAEYARRWIVRYQGGSRGLRERTREEYRRDLERYVIPFLGHKRLTAVRRSDVKEFVAWLIDDAAQAARHAEENRRRQNDRPVLRTVGPLRDATVARILAVLSALFTSAIDDEVYRDTNPCSRIVKPRRDPIVVPEDDEDSDERVKALTRAELAAFLAIVHPDWRTFFRLLAGTGLRVSEALALDVRHLRLDGDRPVVRVRQALSFGRRAGKTALELDRPKSNRGVRDVPLPFELVGELRRHTAALPDPPPEAAAVWGRLAFPSAVGTPMRPENVRRRYLKPAAEEACVAWAGFHAFRHSFASLHLSSVAPT